ncbi:MAG: NADPH-dependent F420 reductase [Nitrososphaerales archaeon]
MARIGFVGGTGDLGTALSLQLSKKHEVLLGSRSLEKARTAVELIRSEKGSRDYLEQNLKPCENAQAVDQSEFVMVTVPHENAIETIKNLTSSFKENQILISTVAAVGRAGDEFVPDFRSGKSFSESILEIVPSSVKVAAAFQTVPAHILYMEREISADVLVTTNERETFEKVASLIRDIEGLRPLYLGTLRLSAEIERLTSLLLNVGKRNKLKSPTLKISSF